jgi:hypothetical protein
VITAASQFWLRPGVAKAERAYLEARANSPPLARCRVPQAVPPQGRQGFAPSGRPLER